MSLNIEIFSNKLRGVIGWTNFLSQGFNFEDGNYGAVFRQTNPIIGGRKAFNIDIEYTTWNIDDYNIDNYKALLEATLSVRYKYAEINDDLNVLGRILCFETCLTTHDGAAIVASNCFLDESDVPPIDTWFYIEEFEQSNQDPILYCWIPKEFESVIEKGIYVEMMGSYSWVEETSALYKKLTVH